MEIHKNGSIDEQLGVITAMDPEVSTAVDQEHDMTARECFKYFLPAIVWAVAMSVSNIMEGFNISLGGNLILFAPFAKQFGVWDPATQSYIIEYKWQIASSLGTSAGGILGAIVGGMTTERFGVRSTMMIGNVLIAGFVFIFFYAKTIGVIQAGCVCNGFAWGMLAQVGSVYSSEVCPTALRGYLINMSNLSFGFGSLLASIVQEVYSTNDTQWAYRIPYGLQWVFPVPLFIIAACAPESPWWLIRRGKIDRVRHSLRRLSRYRTEAQIESQIALMQHTNEFEKSAATQSSFKDCFQGTNLQRTEVACVVLASQGVAGSPLASSPTYFLVQTGLSTINSFRIGVAATAMSVIGNVLCWALMGRFGHRRLFLLGLVGSALTLLPIGILDVDATNPSVQWAQASLCLVWVAGYSILMAPESYTIAGEISATRVRPQTLALAKGFYGVFACAGGVAQAYMANPSGANYKGKSAYPWFAITLLYIVWAYFRLPETKGLTYEEIDVLYEKGVPPRAFGVHSRNATRGIEEASGDSNDDVGRTDDQDRGKKSWNAHTQSIHDDNESRVH